MLDRSRATSHAARKPGEPRKRAARAAPTTCLDERQAFLIFSSILNRPFGAPTNMRLNVLGRQRRSSVLRRVPLRSAIRIPVNGAFANGHRGKPLIITELPPTLLPVAAAASAGRLLRSPTPPPARPAPF